MLEAQLQIQSSEESQYSRAFHTKAYSLTERQ
jgi:hypothetical protein